MWPGTHLCDSAPRTWALGAAKVSTCSLVFLRGFNGDRILERLVCYFMNPCKPPALPPEAQWEETNKTNHNGTAPEQT